MRPLHKGFKLKTGLRSTSRSSFIKVIPMNTVKHSKCAICLERIQDITYLNPCKHRFCFDCVQTWSRKKVVCPLCKQPFHSFFHSVNRKGDFYEYVLPLKDGPLSRSKSMEVRPSTSSQRMASPPDNGIVHDDTRGKQTLREDIYQLMRQFAVTKKPAKVAVISLGKFKAQAALHFRRALYHAGILVQNTQKPDINQIASAEYFAQNPSCIDRLIPWLKRELKVLYGNQRLRVHSLLSFILKNMTQHDLQSKQFEALLQPHLCQFTTHFLHEFLSFVQSPYSVKKYDWHASYECPPLGKEESNPLTSSVSSDDEPARLPTNDQIAKVNSKPDDRKQRSLETRSERDITTIFITEDSRNHSDNEGNERYNLEDLSNSDPEQEVHTAGVFAKNKLHMSQLAEPAHSEGALCHSQMLQYTKENEDFGELHPVQTQHSKNLEAYRSSSNILASGDYAALNFNHGDVAEINAIQILTNQEPTKWQLLDVPTNHFSSSSKRMAASSPGKKIVLKIDGSKGTECSFEEGCTASKERPGKRDKGSPLHEGKGHGNYLREGRVRREQRKAKSSGGSLFCKTALALRNEALRNEGIVARDMNKEKTQKPHHCRKLRSKNYECSRDRIYSEPNWRRVCKRQDCETYRYEEPLGCNGEATRRSSPNLLVSSRIRAYFSPEAELLINQGNASIGQSRHSERCRSVGRTKDKNGQERRPYDKLGGKKKHKSRYVVSKHSGAG